MKYRVDIMGGNIDQRRDLAALLGRHSSFDILCSKNGAQNDLHKSADFVFLLHAPDTEQWRSSIQLLTKKNIPVIAAAGTLKSVPVLSINMETGVCTRLHFKRRSYHSGFCIMGETTAASCEQLVALAETAVKQGYLMQKQAVYYQ
ncbi:MAG: hypothetical protein Q4E20_01435 [Eubacteriales bacterium]|nr:hypothetical protein [Eubacteriales bacterium]